LTNCKKSSRPSGAEPVKFLNKALIRIQVFTQVLIRIQLPKIMLIHADRIGSVTATLIIGAGIFYTGRGEKRWGAGGRAMDGFRRARSPQDQEVGRKLATSNICGTDPDHWI
jgi:hypothetical protein